MYTALVIDIYQNFSAKCNKPGNKLYMLSVIKRIVNSLEMERKYHGNIAGNCPCFK